MKILKKTLFACLLFANTYPVETIIGLFLQKYPYFKTPKMKTLDPEKYSEKLKQPAFLFKETTPHFFETGINGIMALYCGTVAISDHNGMLQFPKLQQEPEIYLLITKGIKFNPDFIIAPSTIHNWGQAKGQLELETTQNYAIYLIKLIQDTKSQIWYYQVEKSEFPQIEDKNSPQWRNGRYIIPFNTITIISDPEDIFVPTGATITQFSSNLLLPPIYIKKSFCFVYNSLYTLAIKQYFSQEQSFYKVDGQTVSHLQQRQP